MNIEVYRLEKVFRERATGPEDMPDNSEALGSPVLVSDGLHRRVQFEAEFFIIEFREFTIEFWKLKRAPFPTTLHHVLEQFGGFYIKRCSLAVISGRRRFLIAFE